MMDAVEAIGRKLELGIFRTSKPIVEDANEKKAAKSKQKNARKSQSRSPSKSPVKSPESFHQRLLMKNSKEKECFAEAVVERKQIAREATFSSFTQPSSEKSKVVEHATFTVKLPKAEQKETAKPQVPVKPNKSEAENILRKTKSTPTRERKKQIIEKSSSVSVEPKQEQCVHLVEQQLGEIARQAEQLAKTIKESPHTKEAENEKTNTTSSCDETKSPVLTIEIAPPKVSASEELSCISPRSSPKKERPPVPERNKTSRTVSTENDIDVDLRTLVEITRSIFEMVPEPSTKMEKSMSHSDIKMNSTISSVMSTSDIKSNEKQRESLADRLTKGLHDLTHGSSDRLQKWKTKLHSNGRSRPKDQSEPPPLSRPMLATVPATDVIFDWASEDRTPRPLHSSKSATNALSKLGTQDMEHRTLKSRENSTSQRDLSFHFQNMSSLQKIMNTIDGYTKVPSHYDLPPPAKFMPSGVRPQHDDIIRPIAFRPLGGAQDDSARHRVSHEAMHLDRPVIRGDHAKSASNLTSIGVAAHIQRPRAMFQPSTSFSPSKGQENEYDTVPDYFEKDKCDFGSSGSDYGCFVGTKLSSSTASSGSSHLSSPPSTNKKFYSTGRSSSGVHVTPSPSDSGIVDFETMIRDKENELREVRSTMEQNEEIVIKVYQEKERRWKEELDLLRTRLAASERGENALRAQLAGCQRQTETLSRTVDGLRDEKAGLLRKCFQLERELNQLKLEMEKPKICEQCRQSQQRPIPAPRNIKNNEDHSLRSEVSSLRDEVATLKEALSGQLKFKMDNENSTRSEPAQNSTGRDRLI